MNKNKIYISADQLLQDSFQLALKIIQSNFRPSFIVGIWRGGAPIGITIQEVLQYCGVITDHYPVRVSSYHHDERREARVYGVADIIENAEAEDALLIIDDVHDSGKSVEALLATLKNRMRRNLPQDIRLATIYYKPECSLTEREPDFYIHKTDQWLIFPHEVEGMRMEEITRYKPTIAAYLQQAQSIFTAQDTNKKLIR